MTTNTFNTLISFYLLQDTGIPLKNFICKLVYKIWRQGLRIHVLAVDQKDGESLDDQLWNWKKESFIPHQLQVLTYPSAQNFFHNPLKQKQGNIVLIGWQLENIPQEQQLIINLTTAPISDFKQYMRICEIIPPLAPDSPQQKSNRDKYRFYRTQGAKLNTFKILK